MLDLRFCDMPGAWQHTSVPIARLDEAAFEDGIRLRDAVKKCLELYGDPLPPFIEKRMNKELNAIIARLEKTQIAVKFAREEANRCEAKAQHCGAPLLQYIFG